MAQEPERGKSNSGSAQPAQPTAPAQPDDQKSEQIKSRIESWLKESEEDATKAEKYLDKKKKDKGNFSGSKEKLAASAKIAAKTDVLRALEVVEDASAKTEKRKKTPPSDVKQEEKKRLIRELGRKPSQEKVALYVRKQSSVDKNEDAPPTTNGEESKTKNFLDSMRKPVDVPTDFLNTIEEERTKPTDAKDDKVTVGQKLAKKYPFNRTTTPNSLREHLKETLAKNLDSSDIAETIECIRDGEILDTFNIDSENVETPPVQRKGLKHGYDKEEEASEVGSLAGERRRRFRGENGKPLGDRELMNKKKKASTTDLSESRDAEDDLGSGLFDRFSTARKTLTRGSIR